MFKSLHTQTSEEIIILDQYWNSSTIEDLRTKGRDNRLACPVCKQPVHVRAGEKKRWHFAHKNLSDCPLRHESPDVLQARSLLYRWLKSKFGNKVTIEKHFPASKLPRPLDCYVELSVDKIFGYWILEKGIRSRFPLQHELMELKVDITWVFLSSMLRIDEEKLTSVHLSPTERDFTYSSIYHEIYSSYDKSLNYLDINDHSVTTLRGLHCVHLPQEYKFAVKLKDFFTNLLISSKNGEFVYKGEYEQLLEHQKAIQAEQQRQEKERQRQNEIRKQHYEQQKKEWYSPKGFVAPANCTLTQPNRIENPQTSINDDFNKAYQCSVCGTLTPNWTTLDLATNTCVCSRECLRVKHNFQ